MDIKADRIVEVWTGDKNSGSSSSGYVIANNLVITAEHGLPSAELENSKCLVRQLTSPGTDWAECTVIWRHADLDVALLDVAESGFSAPPTSAAPALLAARPVTQIIVTAVGFPDSLKRADGTRETEQLRATVETLTTAKRSRMTLHVSTSAPKRSLDGPSQWAGMSGASVFDTSGIVGVLTEETGGVYQGDRLVATYVADLLGVQEFADLVVARGVRIVDEYTIKSQLLGAPPSKPGMVLRPDLLDQVKRALTSAPDVLVGLVGPSGAGKSTLASQLADDLLRENLFDSVLFLEFGSNGDPREVVASAHTRLVGIPPALQSLGEMARNLARELDARHALVILDDPDDDQINQLMGGLSPVPCVVVSRSSHWLNQWNGWRIDVSDLNTDEAINVLRGVEPYQLDRTDAARLVSAVGRWPLLVALASAFARGRMMQGVSGSSVVDEMMDRYEKRGVTAFDARGGSATRAREARRERAVRASVDAMLELLDLEDRDRYLRLVVLPVGETIPIDIVKDLWSISDADTEDLLGDLDGESLLIFDRIRREVRLHSLLHAYLQGLDTPQASWHEQLLRAWGEPLEFTEAYKVRWFSYHLEKAELTDRLQDLVNIAWRDHALSITKGLYTFGEDLLRVAASYQVSSDLQQETRVRIIRATLREDTEKITPVALAVLARLGEFDSAINYLSLLPPQDRDHGLFTIGVRAGTMEPSRLGSIAASMSNDTVKAVFAVQISTLIPAIGQQDRDLGRSIATSLVQILRDIDSEAVEDDFLTGGWSYYVGSVSQNISFLLPDEAIDLLYLINEPSSLAYAQAEVAGSLIGVDRPRAEELLDLAEPTWKRDRVLTDLAAQDATSNFDGALTRIRALSSEAVIRGLFQVARQLSNEDPRRNMLIQEILDRTNDLGSYDFDDGRLTAALLVLPDLARAESLAAGISDDGRRAGAYADIAVRVPEEHDALRLMELAVDLIEHRERSSLKTRDVAKAACLVNADLGLRAVEAYERTEHGERKYELRQTVLASIAVRDFARGLALSLDEPDENRRHFQIASVAAAVLSSDPRKSIAAVDRLPPSLQAPAISGLATQAMLVNQDLARELAEQALARVDYVTDMFDRADVLAQIANVLAEFDRIKARDLVQQSIRASHAGISTDELTYLVAFSRALGANDSSAAAGLMRRAEPSWLKALGLLRVAMVAGPDDSDLTHELLDEISSLVDDLTRRGDTGPVDDLADAAHQVIENALALYDADAVRSTAEAVMMWSAAADAGREAVDDHTLGRLRSIVSRLDKVPAPSFFRDNAELYPWTDFVAEVARALAPGDLATAVETANRIQDSDDLVSAHIAVVRELWRTDTAAAFKRAWRIVEQMSAWPDPLQRAQATSELGAIIASDAEKARLLLAVAMSSLVQIESDAGKVEGIASVIEVIESLADRPLLLGVVHWAQLVVAGIAEPTQAIDATMTLAEALVTIDPMHSRTLAEAALNKVRTYEATKRVRDPDNLLASEDADPMGFSFQRVLVGMSHVDGGRALELAREEDDKNLMTARTATVLGAMTMADVSVRDAARDDVLGVLRARDASLPMVYLSAIVLGLCSDSVELAGLGGSILEALSWRDLNAG